MEVNSILRSREVVLVVAREADGEAIRREAIDDHEYVIVPLVLMTEGVRHAANATNPEFVPASEIEASVDKWDGKPVTLDHPKSNGAFISAEVAAARHAIIGKLANVTAEDGKLRAEAWISAEEVERLSADESHPELAAEAAALFDRFDTSSKVEVSGGYFTRVDGVSGTHDNLAFEGTQREIEPDHAAILRSTQTGACSWYDGCGAPRLSCETEMKFTEGSCACQRCATKLEVSASKNPADYAYVPDAKKPTTWKLPIYDAGHVGGAIAAIGKGYRGKKAQIPASAMAGVKSKIRRAWKKFHPGKKESDMPPVLRGAAAPTANAVSHTDTHRAIANAVSAEKPHDYAYVQDVFDKHFVYQKGSALMKRGYSIGDNGHVALADATTATPVHQVVDYYESDNPADKGLRNSARGDENDLTERVANQETTMTDAEKLAEAAKQKELEVAAAAKAKADAEDKKDKGADEDTEDATGKKKKVAAEATPVTLKSLLANASPEEKKELLGALLATNPEMNESITIGQRLFASRKGELVKQLAVSKAYTEDELKAMSYNDLVRLARFAASVQPAKEERTNEGGATFIGRGLPSFSANADEETNPLPKPGLKVGSRPELLGRKAVVNQ